MFDFDATDSEGILEALDPLTRLGEIASDTWDRAVESFQRIAKVFQPVTDAMNALFKGAGTGLYELFSEADLEEVLDTLNSFLFGGIFLMIRRFADNVSDAFGGIQYRFTEPFRRVNFALLTMQNTLRAMTLMQIAIAVALLTTSLLALSKIDADGLKQGLAGLTALLGQLVATLGGMNLVGGPTGMLDTAAGLVLIAIAVRILVGAVEDLGAIETEQLTKGLTALVTIIGGLTVAVQGMSGHTVGMAQSGAGLLLLAFGIKILAESVVDLAGLDWDEMSRGLVGVGALLAALTLFTQFSKVDPAAMIQGAGIVLLAAGIKILADAAADFAALSWEDIQKGLASITAILAGVAAFTRGVGNPAKVMAAGASLVLIGAAMKILASAMGDFAKFSWEEIEKGLVSMGVALAAIAIALALVPPSTIGSAVAIVGVSAALLLIADAMGQMGNMEWEQIAKGLVAMAGSLFIIAGALMLMTGALPGAAATLVVAAALAILAPVLERLGNMEWMEIVRGLAALAGIFAVIGLAGLVLAPVVPILKGLGLAVLLLGVGIFAVGAGTLMFAAGLGAIAAAGISAVAVVKAFLEMILDLLPRMAEQLGAFITGMAVALGEGAPAIFEAFGRILESFLEMIVEQTPNLIDALIVLLEEMVRGLTEMIPTFVSAVNELFLNWLQKMEEESPSIIEAISNLLVAMLTEMENNVKPVGDAALALMVALINQVTESIEPIGKATTLLIIKLIRTVQKNLDNVLEAGADLIMEFIRGIGKHSLEIAEAAMDAIIDFVDGLATAIDEKSDELKKAGGRLADAIGDGMTGGLYSKARPGGTLWVAARGIGDAAMAAAREALDSSSPSKEFIKIGEEVGDGFYIGLVGSQEKIEKSWTGMTDSLAKASESSGKEVKKLEKQLDRLLDAKELDNEAIGETQLALEQARFEYSATTSALNEMNKGLVDEKLQLDELGGKYDLYTSKLERAEDKLKDIIATRKSYRESITGQFEDLPDLDQDSSLEDFINDLEYANNDLDKFKGVMGELRDLGLSDQLYEEFMEAGTAILPFLEELLDGGVESVEIVNEMSEDLAYTAKQLGYTASRELYNAGQQAAQGLVDGLKSKRAAIEEEAKAIARIVEEAW
ncbi:MAG: hypothetical protein LC687_00925 [Actinobacteria bacterium]|nr:hypothetical protein [Actinomycetota bacterium]